MPSTSVDVVITPDGDCKFIWSDDLAGLLGEGEATVRRASHVEFADGLWVPDLRPIGGPVLPGHARRADALAAEVEWLRANLGAW